MSQRSRRLLDQTYTELCRSVRDVLREKDYSIRTERTYIDWIKRFIPFHRERRPCEMHAPEIEAFLIHLAVD